MVRPFDARLGGYLSLTNFFLHILSSKVMVRLHTENQLDSLPGSASKVSVGGGGWLRVNLVIGFSSSQTIY